MINLCGYRANVPNLVIGGDAVNVSNVQPPAEPSPHFFTKGMGYFARKKVPGMDNGSVSIP